MIPLRDLNPTQRAPVVTMLLILANVVAYIAVASSTSQVATVPTSAGRVSLAGRTAFDLEHAAIPCELTHGRPLDLDEVVATYGRGDETACGARSGETTSPRLFPKKQVALAVLFSMFLHGGIAHLLFNMLFLWVFGNNVEDRLGAARYLAFYLAGGLVATLAHVLVGPSSTVAVVGASGAIAAVMGAYLCWYPRALVITYIPPIFVLPLRARWLLAAWFILQFFTASNSGVAWVAHVGGFLFGVLVGVGGRRLGSGTRPPARI